MPAAVMARRMHKLPFACCRDKQETHRLAERKQQQMAKLENAFGLSGVVEGEAFNRELQEERKMKVQVSMPDLIMMHDLYAAMEQV